MTASIQAVDGWYAFSGVGGSFGILFIYLPQMYLCMYVCGVNVSESTLIANLEATVAVKLMVTCGNMFSLYIRVG